MNVDEAELQLIFAKKNLVKLKVRFALVYMAQYRHNPSICIQPLILLVSPSTGRAGVVSMVQ